MKRNSLTIFFGSLSLIALLVFAQTRISLAETETSSQTTATVGGVLNTTTTIALKTMVIDPQAPITEPGGRVSLRARTVGGETISSATWMVFEAGGGTVTSEGTYIAPSAPGTFHIIAKATGFSDMYVIVTVKASTSGASGTTATTANTTPTATTSTAAATTVTTVLTPVTTTANTVSNTITIIAPTALTSDTTQTLKTMVIDPQTAVVDAGGKITFKAKNSSGETINGVSWAVYEPAGGYIREGSYVAPINAGTYHVIARASGFGEKAVVVSVRAVAPAATTVISTPVITPTPTIAPVPVTKVVTPVETAVVKTIAATTAPATIIKTEPVKVIEVIKTTVATTTSLKTNTTVPAQESKKTEEPKKVEEPKQVSGSTGSGVSGNSGNSGGGVASSSIPQPVRTEPSRELPKPVVTDAEATATSSTVATQIQDITSKVEDVKVTVVESKERLIRVVDEHIADAIRQNGLADQATSTAALKSIREKIQTDLESSFTVETASDSEKIKALGSKITDSLNEIDKIAPPEAVAEGGLPVTRPADRTLDTLVAAIADKATDLRQSGGDLLYKDSNNDGISDYESTHVYNIDPVKPSPVSIVAGREVKAGEKILLGYDPSKSELVRVEREEPKTTVAPVAPSYKLTDVKLAPETKQIVFKGQALPNSYITVYIYSTPIAVIVKTNNDGEWSYTLDKELETGEHTVYTASVDNSGKILARSSGFIFTKTAEAATLDTVPNGVQATATLDQPTVLETNNLYVIIVAFLSIVLVAIGLIGVSVK